MDSHLQKFAAQLVFLSLENGVLSERRVHAILTLLREKKRSSHKKILTHYFHLIKRKLHAERAHIEHAGKISSQTLSQLKNFFEHYYHRSLQFKTNENPALLAGLRVIVKDDIWDASARGKLQTLLH